MLGVERRIGRWQRGFWCETVLVEGFGERYIFSERQGEAVAARVKKGVQRRQSGGK